MNMLFITFNNHFKRKRHSETPEIIFILKKKNIFDVLSNSGVIKQKEKETAFYFLRHRFPRINPRDFFCWTQRPRMQCNAVVWSYRRGSTS